MYKYTDIAYDTTVTYEDEYGNKAYSKYPELSVSGGYRKYIQFFTVKFTVYDKDNYTAYVYVDRREDEKENKNMFERAVKNFFKDNKMLFIKSFLSILVHQVFLKLHQVNFVFQIQKLRQLNL